MYLEKPIFHSSIRRVYLYDLPCIFLVQRDLVILHPYKSSKQAFCHVQNCRSPLYLAWVESFSLPSSSSPSPSLLSLSRSPVGRSLARPRGQKSLKGEPEEKALSPVFGGGGGGKRERENSDQSGVGSVDDGDGGGGGVVVGGHLWRPDHVDVARLAALRSPDRATKKEPERGSTTERGANGKERALFGEWRRGEFYSKAGTRYGRSTQDKEKEEEGLFPKGGRKIKGG